MPNSNLLTYLLSYTKSIDAMASRNKLLLNEYWGNFLGIFRPCFYFLFMENDIFKPTHPTYVSKETKILF